MTVRHVETDEEYKKLLGESKSKLVVIEFFATWCEACHTISPVVEKLADKGKDYVIFAKIDADKMEDLAETLELSVLPTFMFFKDGKKVYALAGANLQALVKKILELKA